MSTPENILDSIQSLWDSVFAPHYLADKNDTFRQDIDAMKTALAEQNMSRFNEIYQEWYFWVVGQTFTADVSGPSLAFDDLEELFLKLQTAVREERSL